MQHKDEITYVGFFMLLCLPTDLYTHICRGELKCLKTHFVDLKSLISNQEKIQNMNLIPE